jgi:predicted TIM-barrel fold metal-dependent hydrolase
MTYAGERRCHDADSHLMELTDWLPQYADPDVRDRIRPLALGGAGKLADDAVRNAEARRGDADAAAALEHELLTAKGWHALGAFDPSERSRVLDLLGFDSQLVFSTFAPTQFLGDDVELLYGGTRAHNRAMVDFCRDDPRMVPVAFVPWGVPALTVEAVDEALAMGAGAVLVTSAPPRDRSPFHPDYDGVWARLADAGVPCVLHGGGGGRTLKPAYHDNALRRPTDFLGGGENIRSKDFMTLQFGPETFLSCMVLDGVFDRFPRLRGGCIEQGAMWVVPWMRRLDIAQQTFRRTEPTVRDLELKPSEYVHRNLWFTPFPTEPVGWMIEQAGDDLFLFSSDYPHPEGGKDPIARFEASLDAAAIGDDARRRFWWGNYADMMGIPAPAGVGG